VFSESGASPSIGCLPRPAATLATTLDPFTNRSNHVARHHVHHDPQWYEGEQQRQKHCCNRGRYNSESRHDWLRYY
jgi:hypothetical protein